MKFEESWPFLAALALALHVFADFNLQGILGSLKCEDFWRNLGNFKGEPRKCREKWCQGFYNLDWLPCLLAHSFLWAFATFLPLRFTTFGGERIGQAAFCGTVVLNAAFHAAVDHWKCNKFAINLLADQSLHLAQIALTFAVLALCL